MALPAMITDFGAQQANYGAAVGQSLAQLGQQVGQQLAMREYQRQASAALPAMQSSFQSALSKIQSGDVSDAYIDLLNTQMQFGSTTNPFIQSAMANFSDLALKAGEMKKSELFRQAQYGGGTGGGAIEGIPAVRQPQGPKAFFNNGNVPQEYDGGELPIDTSVGGEGVGEMMAKDNGMSFGAGVTGNWSFTSSDYTQPSEELTESIKENETEYLSSSTEEAVKYRQSVSSSTIPEGTQFVELPGLSNFKGFENVKGVFIPNREYIDFPKSLSVTEDEKGQRFKTDFEKVQVNQQQMEKANALAYTDAPTAIGRVAGNQSLERFFKENNPEKLDIGERVEDGQTVYYIGVRNTKDYITISKDDYIAARVLRDLPSTSRTLRASLAISETPAATTSGTPTSREEQLRQAQAILGITAPSTAPAPPPTPTPTPVAGIPAVDMQNLTPAERERLMTERIRAGLGAAGGAVMRGGEAILRGARAIR